MPYNPPMQTTLPDDHRNTRAYRRLMQGRNFKHRIARLRALFAMGLGREVPVSQAEFSFWCGMSRDTITAVESGKTLVSTRLAERIYDMTGAELSWLTGRVDEEAYGYPSLQAWFPRTMPLAKDDIERDHGFRTGEYHRIVHHILEPLAMRAQRETDSVLLPASVADRFFSRFTDRGGMEGYPPLWQAFAFAPGPDAMLLALDWGMLGDVPTAGPLRPVLAKVPADRTAKVGKRLLAEICHNLILTLSEAERGVEWKADGCETAETSSGGATVLVARGVS